MTTYIIVSLCISLIVYISLLVEDIIDGPDHKFGPAYKSSFTYIITFMWLPFINIIFILGVIFLMVTRED